MSGAYKPESLKGICLTISFLWGNKRHVLQVVQKKSVHNYPDLIHTAMCSPKVTIISEFHNKWRLI